MRLKMPAASRVSFARRSLLLLGIACVLMALAAATPPAAAQDACPTVLRFQTDHESTDVDLGWTGLFHDVQLDASLDLAVSGCSGAVPDCGTCTLSGPVDDPLDTSLAARNRRCSCDTSTTCDDASDCPGACACSYFFGAPTPISAGGVPICMVNTIVGPVTGTVETHGCGVAAADIHLNLVSRMYVGEAPDEPCPTCIAQICSRGPRVALPCAVQGQSVDLGDTSLDCPPWPSASIGVLPLPLDLGVDLQTWTLTGSSPLCGNGSGERCFCSSCSGNPSLGCSTNADCASAGAGTCGGPGCAGGINAGAPCASNADCPGSACTGGSSGAAAATAPNSCNGGTCLENTPPDHDSIDEGVCSEGPVDRYCTGAPWMFCSSDVECSGAGTCSLERPRECFTDNGVVGGDVSVAGVNLALGDLACIGSTVSPAVNGAAGFPGPARFTLPGRMTLAPCCEEEGDEAEEDADVDTEEMLGTTEELYGGIFDTDTDIWSPALPCPPSIGIEDDPDDLLSDEEDQAEEMLEAGFEDAAFDDLMQAIADAEEAMELQAEDEADDDPFTGAGPVSGPYTAPSVPHAPDPDGCYVFGGRDIVFVHGLRNNTLKAALDASNPDHAVALAGWQFPTSFPDDSPAGLTNPNAAQFYRDGYWKKGAEQYWEKHIQRHLTQRGIKNRYLIVGFASPQRLAIGAQAVLTQISDAMRFGEGVVNPADPSDTGGFGTPSFVIISHSTGSPVIDVAMSAASKYPNLQAQFIPSLAKAHIGWQGAFSGSHLASAALLTANPLLCQLARSHSPFDPCSPLAAGVLNDSVLVDLSPHMMQRKWGGKQVSASQAAIDRTPVRTVTVTGSHPSSFREAKHFVLLGFDDGVLTVNSQTANPNAVWNWPSGHVVTYQKKLLKDIGIRENPFDDTSDKARKRRRGYYRDQVRRDPERGADIEDLVSSSAAPYLGPTGVFAWKDLNAPALSSDFDPKARYENHFSFIQAATDHFGSTPGSSRYCWDGSNHGGICSTNDDCAGGTCDSTPGSCDGESTRSCRTNADCSGGDECKSDEFFPAGGSYEFTDTVEFNVEETRAITDDRIFDNYDTPCDGSVSPCFPDSAPLVRRSDNPDVEYMVRGRRKKNPKKGWRWKREYFVLQGWKTKRVGDYVYGSLLKVPPAGITLASQPAPSCDCAEKPQWKSSASRCVFGVATAARIYVDRTLRDRQECIVRNLEGADFCSPEELEETLADRLDALESSIVARCPEALPSDLARLGFPGPCADDNASNGFTRDDLRRCIRDSHDGLVSQLVRLEFGGYEGAVAVPSETTECLAELAKASRRVAIGKLKAVQKCRADQAKGKLEGVDCHGCDTDLKVMAKIAKLEAKARSTIAQTCIAPFAPLSGGVCHDGASLEMLVDCLMETHLASADSDDYQHTSRGFADFEFADPVRW